jgi:hypothetical protein
MRDDLAPGHAAGSPRERGEVVFEATGEVSERAELLNGFLQLSLDGEAVQGDGRWLCASSLAWQLGRTGEVALKEGDLSLEDGDHELFAVLEHGTAEADLDTGSAVVRAVFTVDGARGDWAAPGDRVGCDLRIEIESWRGEIRVRPAAELP